MSTATFLITPGVMQVIVVALVMSFIIKRDSEVVDYEDTFGEMKTVDDIAVQDSNYYGEQVLRCRFIDNCLFNAMHGQNINLPLCVCLSHFLSTRLQVRPLNGFLQLIA